MKLFEIIDTKRVASEAPDYSSMSPEQRREIGIINPDASDAGVFSYVRDMDDDPHLVHKTSKSSTAAISDGFWVWAEHLVDNELWHNPFFPRVYEITDFDEIMLSNKKTMFQAKIERLFHANTMEFHEVVALFKRFFNEVPYVVLNNYNKYLDSKSEFSDNKGRQYLEDAIFTLLAHVVKHIYNRIPNPKAYAHVIKQLPRNTVPIVDDTLREAIDEIVAFANDNPHINVDMTIHNIMVRRNPRAGAQIVFTDPFV